MSNQTTTTTTTSLPPSPLPQTTLSEGIFGLGEEVDLYIFIGGGVGIFCICVLLIGIICLLRSDSKSKSKHISLKSNKMSTFSSINSPNSKKHLNESHELQKIVTSVHSMNSVISSPINNPNLGNGSRQISNNPNINSFMSSVQRQNFPQHIYQPPPQGFRNRGSIDAWNGVVRNPPINHMGKLPDGSHPMNLSLNPQKRQQQLYEQQQIQAQLARDAEMALKLYQEQLRQFGVEEDIDPGQVEGGETGNLPGTNGEGNNINKKLPKINQKQNNNEDELEEGDKETIEEEERQIKEAMIKSENEEIERKKKEELEDQRKIDEQEKKEKELLLKKKYDIEQKQKEEQYNNFNFQGYGIDNNDNDIENSKQPMIKPPQFDMPQEYQNIDNDNQYNYNNNNDNYYDPNYDQQYNNNNNINNNHKKPPPPPPKSLSNSLKKNNKAKPPPKNIKNKKNNKKSNSKVLNAANMFNKIDQQAKMSKPLPVGKRNKKKFNKNKVKIPNAPWQ